MKAHFGNRFGLVTRPSAPIAYFSITVPRMLGSVSVTLKPNLKPVGIGFVGVPLPRTVVEALVTL